MDKNKKMKKNFTLMFLVSGILTTSVGSVLLINSNLKDYSALENSYQSGENNISTYATTTQTNYLSGAAKPTNYSSYNPLAINDGSQAIVTDYGYLGIDVNSTTLYMCSFSGYIMWSMQPSNNEFIKNYYSSNSLTITGIKIQQWSFLESKNAIILLLGDNDGNNQTIVALDAKTGLLFNPTTDNELNVTKAPIEKVNINQTTGYNRLYKISDNTLLLTKIGNKNTYTNSIKITVNSNSISVASVTLNFSTNSLVSDSDVLTSIVSGNNVAFALFTTSTPKTNETTHYEQYIVAIDTSFNVISSQKATLSNNFIATNSTGNSFMNFGCVVDDNKGTQNLYILSGNTDNRYLNYLKYTTSSKSLSFSSSVNLSGNVINSIVFDQKFNSIYIGNKSSTASSLLGYIDLSKTTLSYTNIIGTISQTFTRACYAIPMKEYLQSTPSQIVLYLDQTGNMKYATKDTTDNQFKPSSTSLPMIGWNCDSFYSNVKNLNLGSSMMQSNVNLNTIKSALTLSSTSNVTLSYSKKSINDTYGTLSFDVNVKYPFAFDEKLYSSFNIPINLNGFYKINTENYSFQFVTSQSIDSAKWTKIQNLMKTKFAKDVTQDEVFECFWTGSIKDKSLNNISITKEMFTVNGNYGNLNELTVTFKLPNNLMPTGFPSNKLTITQKYSGFLSIEGFGIEANSDQIIKETVSTIYPSQLTKEIIINNFITCENNIYKDENYWNCTITEIDDFNGTATISLSYKYESVNNIPDVQNFPVSIFTIFTSKKISGFKSISSSINGNIAPTFKEYSSNYLPSEIWNQYVSYSSSNQSGSILIDNLNFDLIEDKNNVLIDLNNPLTCDADKYLDLKISIKENSLTKIEYDGNQFQSSNNKLVFSSELLQKLEQFDGINYPFNNVIFSMITLSKYFDVIGPDGKNVSQTQNAYIINLNDYPNNTDYIFTTKKFAKIATENNITKIIKTSGYNYSFSNFHVNNKKGYIIADIYLELSTPPLVPTIKNNSINQTGGIENNSTRKIIIYNFRVPEPDFVKTTNIIAFTSIGISVVVASIWLSIWYIRKRNYKRLGVDLNVQEENKKRFDILQKKYDLTQKVKEKNKKDDNKN